MRQKKSLTLVILGDLIKKIKQLCERKINMRTVFKILCFSSFIYLLNIGYSSVGLADDETVNHETFGTTSAENKIPDPTKDYIEYVGNGWFYVQSQGTTGAWIATQPPEEETYDWISDLPNENAPQIDGKAH